MIRQLALLALALPMVARAGDIPVPANASGQYYLSTTMPKPGYVCFRESPSKQTCTDERLQTACTAGFALTSLLGIGDCTFTYEEKVFTGASAVPVAVRRLALAPGSRVEMIYGCDGCSHERLGPSVFVIQSPAPPPDPRPSPEVGQVFVPVSIALAPPSPPPPPPVAPVVLLREGFEDGGFAARGWYDNTNPVLVADRREGAQAVRFTWTPSVTVPPGGAAMRRKFPESESVTIAFWVKHSPGFVGSGKNYHPHLFSLMTNQNGEYHGPSVSRLTTYVEEVGGFAQLGIQDAENIDQGRRGQDLRGVTESRAVAGCNGPQLEPHTTSCYDRGGGQFTNVLEWRADARTFTAEPGPSYQGEWRRVEATFQMNTVREGKAIADGVARYVLDGRTVIERKQVIYRTGANATMKFNQLLLAPFIGDGSPVEQWIAFDGLVVSTAPVPTDPGPPPPPPPGGGGGGGSGGGSGVPPVGGTVIFSEGFENGNKGGFDWDADGRTTYTQQGCHSGNWCGVKTLTSTANQQRVFWEKEFSPRITGPQLYVSAWWNFEAGYSFAGVPGISDFGLEHKMVYIYTEGDQGNALAMNLRYENGQLSTHMIGLESNNGVSKFSGYVPPFDGKWHRYEYLVTRSPSPTGGNVKVWVDGVLRIDANGGTCPASGCRPVQTIKIGTFRNQGNPKVQSFKVDDVLIGTSRP